MTRYLNTVIMIVGAWLAFFSPWIFHRTGASLIILLAAGILSALLAFIRARGRNLQWPSILIALIGLFLVLWGAFVARLAGNAAGANEIISGILLLILAVSSLAFPHRTAESQIS